jgi:hypothetical protein
MIKTVYVLQDTNGNYHGAAKTKKNLMALQRELRQCGIATEIKTMYPIEREVYNREFKRRNKNRVSGQLEYTL